MLMMSMLLDTSLHNDTAPRLSPAELLGNSTLHNSSKMQEKTLMKGASVNETGENSSGRGALEEEPAANGSRSADSPLLAPTSTEMPSNSSEPVENLSSDSHLHETGLVDAEALAAHNNGNKTFFYGRASRLRRPRSQLATGDDGRTVAVVGALVPLCLFLCCQYDKICKIKPSARRVKAPRVQVRQGLQVVCQEQATMSVNGTDFMEMDANEDTDEDSSHKGTASSLMNDASNLVNDASQQLQEALPEAWQEAIAEATGQTRSTAYYDLSTPR